MDPLPITRNDARMILDAERARIIRVDFIKRTDGTYRMMVCRPYIRRAKTARLDAEHRIIKVVDMLASKREQSKQYRTINLDAICRIRADHMDYVVEDD